MSRNEIGSHNRSRAEVITRSTARRCDATVSSRPAEFGLNASACCIFPQCFPQLSRHGHRNYPCALALHAGDLLFATGHQLFTGGGAAPVLKVHSDTVLSQFTEAHSQYDLVESDKLRHKLT